MPDFGNFAAAQPAADAGGLGGAVKGRVLVAMSGGVDSSVAAALLVDQGYEVIGVTMQVWDYSQCEVQEGYGTCCSSIDVDDARSVADRLGIPFYVINCEAKFKEKVIDPFIDQYLQGQTPLPCVNCNTYLKFEHLIEKMRELECDFLATGHYAKLETIEGVPQIVTSSDDWKDQTYFLFTIDPQVVPKILFPIGHLKKDQVRQIATEKQLVNARKKDSTGICFVGNGDYAKFVEDHGDKCKIKPGIIRKYPTGEVLAEHAGIHAFTLGQRKGLGFASGAPQFVIRIDSTTGDVWVGDEEHLMSRSAVINELHFLDQWQESEVLNVKIRYHHKGALAKLRRLPGNRLAVEFLEPVRAITPGQAAVIYRKRQLVGGGWIMLEAKP